MVNMQMSLQSRPSAMRLFYLKGVAPPNIDMGNIFKSALPFLPIRAICLFLVIVFPQPIFWLPKLVYG